MVGYTTIYYKTPSCRKALINNEISIYDILNCMQSYSYVSRLN